ncbi:LLM class F420-dependent oxidoreductase [Candidatus Viridilinea mediisalina]|uniref:LLM class F420-dependent oxidoreductase n=1 Tax=Candidatus Viridilinea mediisalina TaxID=2024553 RepID=A0A2A6RGE1_9CHLR|nr:LLM class F420-dependent oxidoreductase [Candidatus Viridilinea mediisalina]PDW01956.1 LLM class F420-dependent oxidoreductase [Candidatus Viridilinea mediisalina]
MALQFGTFVPQGWRLDLMELNDPIEKYEAMTRVATAVDAMPVYDSIWVYDHFHTVPRIEQETVFEAWTITAALARDTKRVKLGQMVTCIGYRNPALAAKIASTVDVLSHGRLYCGIGAGWYEHEWRAYGYGFPETRDRMRAFREATQIMVKLWTEETPTFEGEYFQIHGAINEPRGVQKPHPSLWIGGGGEQVTLKLVAQYGNAANVLGDPATIRHKWDVLRQHCDTVGRDYATIIKSTNANIVFLKPGDDLTRATEAVRATYRWSVEDLQRNAIVGEPAYVVERLAALRDAGADYFITYFPRIAYDHTPLHIFAEEVAPLL